MDAPAGNAAASTGLDNEIEMLIKAAENAMMTPPAVMQFARAALIAGNRVRDGDAEVEECAVNINSSCDECRKRGRGNTVTGTKAACVRGSSRHVYDNIMHCHHLYENIMNCQHPAVFLDHTRFGPEMLNSLITIVGGNIGKTLDLGLRKMRSALTPRKRFLRAHAKGIPASETKKYKNLYYPSVEEL